jgi:hypothetical protein
LDCVAEVIRNFNRPPSTAARMSFVVTRAPIQPRACALERRTPRITGICAIDLTDFTRRAVSYMSIHNEEAGQTASASGVGPGFRVSAISSEPRYFIVHLA